MKKKKKNKKTLKKKKKRKRANTICSTSANCDFRQFDFGQLAEVELAEVEHTRARMVVFGVEVGGRWSAEANVFLKNLAAVEARGGASLARGSGSCCLVPQEGCSAVQLRGFSVALSWMLRHLVEMVQPRLLNAILGEARNA